MPVAAALESYYDRYYQSTTGVAQVTMDDPRRLARRICRHASRFATGEVRRILDFGGGDGSISFAVAEGLLEGTRRRAEVTIIDYGDRLAKPPACVRAIRVEELDAASGPYDLVIASAVLEHLPDPTEALNALSLLMGDGALLYVRTPFVAPMLELAQRVHVHADFTFPGHLHDLGEAFWNRLLEWWTPPVDALLRVASNPSPVETNLRKHPVRTVAAAVLKAPYRALGSRWVLVGGWEAAFVRYET
jgi:SAM-dependent methyltransferase